MGCHTPRIAQMSPRNGNLYRKGKAQTSRPKHHKVLRGMDAASTEGTFLNLNDRSSTAVTGAIVPLLN